MSLVKYFAPLFLVATAALMLADESFSLGGHVTDPSGNPVPHATIKLYNRDASGSYTATTDAQGNYTLLAPRGEYLLQAEAAGLTLPKSPRLLNLNSSQTLPLQLGIPDVATAWWSLLLAHHNRR